MSRVTDFEQILDALGMLTFEMYTVENERLLTRKNEQITPLGGLLDHGSDAVFVTATISALTYHDCAPIALAIIIPIAFLQYVFDSKALEGRPLKANLLGKYNGITYFLFAGFRTILKTHM